MRKAAPRTLSRALEGLTAAIAPATTLARVQEIWEPTTGPSIAAAARPTAERGGVLTVSCVAAVWAQELDLMAAELCRAQGESDDGVYFPFAGDEADLDYMVRKRHFDRAGSAAIKLLKETKPYKSGNVALRAIHDLNVQDKHRALLDHRRAVAGHRSQAR